MGRPTTIKVGVRLGRLEIIGVRTFGAGKNAVAVCRCDCGVTKDVKYVHLTKVKSCGCSQHDPEYRKLREQASYPKKADGEAAMHSFFCSYRAKARRHGDDFALTKEDFVSLVTQPCVYCGAPPAPRMSYRNGRPMYNGAAFASGLDRVQNHLGYTTSNSVPCCTECNLSKHTRSKDDFLAHALRVVEHQRSLPTN